MSAIVKKPSVAIIGRVNVGKSTFFNRLLEESKALVSPLPGTTRSPNYGDAIWRGRVFEVVDTGGYEKRPQDSFGKEISAHAAQAAKEADVILFLIDLKVGILPEDRTIAKALIKNNKPVILAGNKADFQVQKPSPGTIGFNDIQIISATTGRGIGDLLDLLFEKFKEIEKEPPTVEEEIHPLRVAILGKPNVGKSSLLNALVGSPRAVVSEIANTTREPQDTLVRIDEELYLFIDTAGIRKNLKHQTVLEGEGVRKTLAVLKRTDIVIFVLDPHEGMNIQDKHIAGLILDAGVSVIMTVNKWDLVKDRVPGTQNIMTHEIIKSIPFLTWAPILHISAKTGQHVKKIFASLKKVNSTRAKKIETRDLDRFFRKALAQHPSQKNKKENALPFVYSMRQEDAVPPTFIINIRGNRERIHPAFLRYIQNRLREEYDFEGTPIFVKPRTIRPNH